MKLLVTVPWDAAQLRRIREAFPALDIVVALTEAHMVQAVCDAEVVFGDVSRAAFLNAKTLQWIQCHGAGVNKLVAIPELVASDVRLTNTSGAHAPTIAEHFFGTLIALTRKLPDLYAAQQRGEWVHWADWPTKIGRRPRALAGMTLGIIGFGNIGRAIAERAAAFQMNVIAVDVRDVSRPAYLSELWRLDNLPQLLSQSDVVVVTVPGTPETDNLLDGRMLSHMKPTAYLGVFSRGGIVDEDALAQMLVEGRLEGAMLDVFNEEPLASHSPLWKAPNLILTPHCCGKSENTTAAATSIFIENLRRYLAGDGLVNVVNKALGF